MAESKFEGWAILELMGHRRLGGFVSEATLAGGAFLRIDVPAEAEGTKPATQFYSPSSVYCLTPTTEETARAVAKLAQPAPVQRWELRQLPERTSATADNAWPNPPEIEGEGAEDDPL